MREMRPMVSHSVEYGPGPGAYNVEGRREQWLQPGFSFAGQTRKESKGRESVGPARYDTEDTATSEHRRVYNALFSRAVRTIDVTCWGK